MVHKGEENQKEPEVFQQQIGYLPIHALPVHLKNVEEDYYEESCKEVHKAESLAGASDNIENEDAEDGEVEGLELLVLLGYFYWDCVFLVDLGVFHFNDVLVELGLAVLFYLFWLFFRLGCFWGFLTFAPLSFSLLLVLIGCF